MYKYKHTVVLGEFLPFHNGHVELIKRALDQSEKVTVVIAIDFNSTKSRPAHRRYHDVYLSFMYEERISIETNTYLKDLIQTGVTINDTNSMREWAEIIDTKYGSDIDSVFSEYEHHYKLADFLPGDVDFTRMPFNKGNGSLDVRANPLKFWSEFPDHVARQMHTRIAVYGICTYPKHKILKELSKEKDTSVLFTGNASHDSDSIDLNLVKDHASNTLQRFISSSENDHKLLYPFSVYGYDYHSLTAETIFRFKKILPAIEYSEMNWRPDIAFFFPTSQDCYQQQQASLLAVLMKEGIELIHLPEDENEALDQIKSQMTIKL